jgi:HSP20 family protein
MTTELAKKEQRAPVSAERTRGGVTYNPRIDILEAEDELLLLADLPGVEPAELNIRYENKELMIEGKVAPRQGDVRYLYNEYGIGDFYRQFTIGEAIDAEKISAELKHGVLTVHLPKTDAVRPRRIPVQGG